MLKEFKEFAVRGNILDLAVGIIVGTAFGKIVSSLVADVIMPPIGVLLGGVAFSDLAITVRVAVGEAPAVLIRYGQFIQTIIDFIIIAFAVFMALKVVSRLKRKEEIKSEAVPAQEIKLPAQEVLLMEIRDLLKERRT